MELKSWDELLQDHTFLNDTLSEQYYLWNIYHPGMRFILSGVYKAAILHGQPEGTTRRYLNGDVLTQWDVSSNAKCWYTERIDRDVLIDAEVVELDRNYQVLFN